jgi:hypothetical protein
MRGPAFLSSKRPAASAALAGAAALIASSCYLTSSFDGLTNEAGSAGATSSTGGSGGATSSDSTGGTGAQGGSSSSSGGSGGAGGSTSSSGGSTGDPAFPATAILDDFNRPDGPPGDPWKQTEDGSYGIVAQQLTALVPNPQSILWDNAFGPRQEAFVTLNQFVPEDVELELILRNQGHPSECESVVASYMVASYNTFSGFPHAISLAYCVNGDWHGLGDPLEITLTPGDQLGFRGYADGTLKVYVNGEEKGTWDGTPWAEGTSGGRIGIFASGLSDPPMFEDFGGGDF